VSIRTRLLLLILFATLIPAMVGGMMVREYRESQVADAKRELAGATRQIAQALTDTIRSTAQLHYGLSRARDFEIPGRAACSAFLADVLKAYPQYTGILTINPDGQLYCDSLRTGRTLNLTDRRYFQEAMKAETPLAVEPAFGRLTGMAVLQIAYGVHREKTKSSFVLLASLNLEKLMQAHAQALPHVNAMLALMDGKGTILTWHPDGDKRRGSSIVESALYRMAIESSGTVVRENVEVEGISRIWAVSKLPDFENTGLHVLLGVSTGDLLAAANRKLTRALATLAAVWVLVFAGALALGEMAIRRQTARVVAAVSEFSAGKFDTRIGAPYPRGEIGDLMVALDEAFAAMQSQRQVIEELNTDLERRVNERTAELQTANKELEAFSYTVSHDLRGPLRHVNGFAQLARDRFGTANADTLRYLDKIVNAAKRMSMLIDDMLVLSRVGRVELKSMRVELASIVRQTQEECMRDAGERNIVWKIGELPAVRGDPGLLRQVFVNLIGNAVKYSAGVAGTVIEITAAPAGADEVCVSVRDNGAGFDMAYADKLFGVFQRLHNDDRFAGTGIGLATVKRIVERHGGRIRGEGAVGQGAVFHVVLKIAGDTPAATGGLLDDIAERA
jgi:signal transduction histidine kinase